MKKPKGTVLWIFGLLLATGIVSAQENQKYEKNGVSFDYAAGWELKEKTGTESDEIALSNAESDSQITVIVVRKKIDSKDPIADAKKRVIDPWLNSMILQYSKIAQIEVKREDIKTEVADLPTDGVKLSFLLDGQGGSVDACWIVVNKKIVLLYMVSPDKKADKVKDVWALLRKTLRVVVGEK